MGARVVPIRVFLKDAVFSPEVISAMNAALEDVCKEAFGRSDISKEMIAAMIIDLARSGEADPVVLREMTLGELGLSRSPEKP
jgi:hypothetical protein